MNANDFIEMLSNNANLSSEDAKKVNLILENTFLAGKTNKSKIIEEVSTQLGVDECKADEIYNQSMNLLKDSFIDKLKNPFGKQ